MPQHLEASHVDPLLHQLPLLALSDQVHFPLTDLRLRLVDPEYCTMVQDLFLSAGRDALVGTVLLRPGYRTLALRAPVYAEGTAARLISVTEDRLGVDVVMRGEARFLVERETDGTPCREALVRWLEEPALSESDPDVQGLRRELLDTTTRLAAELGAESRLHGQLVGMGSDLPFEAVVNRMAAGVDISPAKQHQLLRDTVPDRALRLLTILRHRQQVLNILRPYRQSGSAEIN